MFLASSQAYFYSIVQWSSVVVWVNLFLVLHIQDVIVSADYLFRLITHPLDNLHGRKTMVKLWNYIVDYLYEWGS